MYKAIFLWWVVQKRRLRAWFVRVQQLLWFYVCLRGNEFHASLDFDPDYYDRLTPKQRAAYSKKQLRRRNLAGRIEEEKDIARLKRLRHQE